MLETKSKTDSPSGASEHIQKPVDENWSPPDHICLSSDAETKEHLGAPGFLESLKNLEGRNLILHETNRNAKLTEGMW